jgi:hypothetical protein
MSRPNEHPEIAEVDWIDYTFRIEETRWKTFRSFAKNGKELVTSLYRDVCITATRFYLKRCQEGWVASTTYKGIVGEKF